MENVPDMALDREMFILRTMVDELETLGYAVEERVVDTSRYGVPQFRQRLILVALRDGTGFKWPEETPDKVTVWNAIGDLPAVEGGWRPLGGADGWSEYDRPQTEFQHRMRRGMDGADAGKVHDHITRPVREDDKRAFQLMDATTLYSDLPAEMKRYRDDIFDDKYKRLDEDEPVTDHNGPHRQRRVLVHPSPAGPHPDGSRGGTAADVPGPVPDSPDHHRPRSGRSVTPCRPSWANASAGRYGPVWLIRSQPGHPRRRSRPLLAEWFTSLPTLSVPWLRARARWQVIFAEITSGTSSCPAGTVVVAAARPVGESGRYLGGEG